MFLNKKKTLDFESFESDVLNKKSNFLNMVSQIKSLDEEIKKLIKQNAAKDDLIQELQEQITNLQAANANIPNAQAQPIEQQLQQSQQQAQLPKPEDNKDILKQPPLQSLSKDLSASKSDTKNQATAQSAAFGMQQSSQKPADTDLNFQALISNDKNAPQLLKNGDITGNNNNKNSADMEAEIQQLKAQLMQKDKDLQIAAKQGDELNQIKESYKALEQRNQELSMQNSAPKVNQAQSSLLDNKEIQIQFEEMKRQNQFFGEQYEQMKQKFDAQQTTLEYLVAENSRLIIKTFSCTQRNSLMTQK